MDMRYGFFYISYYTLKKNNDIIDVLKKQDGILYVNKAKEE